MSTMISNLPRDLIEEILSRVPLKSLRNVRLTCKKWDKLSKTRSFSKMHIGKEASAAREGESQMIVMMDNDVYLMSLFLDGDPSTEPKGKLSCVNKRIQISQVFYFEGLLLCIWKENDDDTTLVVCNPYLGQTRWIKTRYTYQGHNGRYTDRYRYALGYVYKKNKSCRSHKILRFFDKTYQSKNRFFWYEIYDFESGLWTTLDVPSHWFITSSQRGVSLKGNTYFCATKANLDVEIDELNNHLICFDYTSERFGPLLPFPFDAGYDDYVTLSCVKEEKLAALLTHNEYNPYELDIWITTSIEPEKVLWSKFLTLDTEPEYPIASGGFFIDEQRKVAMGFAEDDNLNHHTLSVVGEAGYLIKLVLGVKIRRNPYVCPYVPSLVKIKKPAGVKRNKQSKLEKQRYDEKMSTLTALENTANKQSVGGKRKKNIANL